LHPIYTDIYTYCRFDTIVAWCCCMYDDTEKSKQTLFLAWDKDLSSALSFLFTYVHKHQEIRIVVEISVPLRMACFEACT
jgi:hypothetical protein